jgi:hypothetical protein
MGSNGDVNDDRQIATESPDDEESQDDVADLLAHLTHHTQGTINQPILDQLYAKYTDTRKPKPKPILKQPTHPSQMTASSPADICKILGNPAKPKKEVNINGITFHKVNATCIYSVSTH